MLQAKSSGIIRALPLLSRRYAARPDRRPGALGASLLAAALLSVGLLAAALLLGPAGPVQAEDSRPPAPTAQPAQQQAVSSDATLSGLELLDWHSREVPLRPAFSAQTGEYGATLPLLSTGLVRLRPTANHSGATITVDGKAVASGAKSDYFSLEINTPQRVVVAVTAEDGVTRREYAVTVTKDPRAELSGLSASDVKLHPFVFSGRNTEYRGWVAHSVTEVKVTPTNRYAKGTITVNGHTVASGQASPAIALSEGENVITATITAPDDYTSRTYTLTITRATAAASADATLRSLAIHTATSSQPDAGNEVPYAGAAYPLSPALTSGVYEYRVVVPEAVARRARESEESGYVYVTAVATTTAPGAKSIVVQGQKSLEEARHPKREVVTGESSGPWYAFVGYSPIRIEVTSLDGKNTQTYLVVVEHGGDLDDPRGVAVTPGDGQLTLSWGENTGDAAPRLYWARWREAGTTTWLNEATLAGWKTGYGDGAPEATAADGQRVVNGSYVITGLTNGTEYEVELRGTRAGATSYRVTNWLQSRWVTVKGTPGQAATTRTLTITPSAPSREYGGTDDLSYTVSGLVDGDAATDVVTGTLTRAAGNDAGSYAFDLSGLSIATAYAGKYALPASPAIASYTITPRAITAVSGVTVNSRPADGSTTATFDTSAANGTGVLSSELSDFRAGGLQVSGTFPAATPGTHDVSVTYTLGDQGSFKAANYTLSAATDTLQGQLTQVPVCAAGLMLFADGAPAEGGSAITVTAGLASPAGTDGVAVTLTTGGTATVGADYTLSSTTVTIAAGATAGVSTVTVVDDAIDDDDETIILNAAVAAALTAAPLTLTIADNDDAPAPTPTPTPTPGPEPRPGTVDYDTDDDGLIEVSSRAQLNAIRWDVDGDGSARDAGYADAFPGAAVANGLIVAMGCPATGCIGYELITDLDLGNAGWSPIAGGNGGTNGAAYAAVFEGNDHTISNLYVRADCCGGVRMGLFHFIGPRGVVRNLNLRKPSVGQWTIQAERVGALAGDLAGRVEGVRVTGARIGGAWYVGGLAGWSSGVVTDSYVQANITSSWSSGGEIGGLIGRNYGVVRRSFAWGSIAGALSRDAGGLVGSSQFGSSIIASGALVDFPEEITNRRAGLVGRNAGKVVASYSAGSVGEDWGAGLIYANTGTVKDSYWDITKSPRIRRTFGGPIVSGGPGVAKTTDELREPMGYSGIYANWNVDVDGDGAADDPWDFGTACQYPIPKSLGLDPPGRGGQCPVPAGLSSLRLLERVLGVSVRGKVGDNLIADPAITSYTVHLAENVIAVSLTPEAQRPDATTITVDGKTIASGSTVHLSRPGPEGTKVVVILVTEGGTERTYTLSLVRGSSESGSPGQQANRAPTVSAALADVSGLEVSATQDVSLAGVFSDADGDALTITAASSDEAKATVSVTSAGSNLTLTGVSEGTATITVIAQDPDGERASDTFEVEVVGKYAGLIAQMYQWRNDPQWRHQKSHTDRWDRALLAFGETVADTTLTAMTAAEAQALADQDWGERWVPVAQALREIEANRQQQAAPNRAPTVSAAIADATIVNQSGTQTLSLTGGFDDADNDALTMSASSSDEAVATVSVATDYSALTVSARARGTVTITVAADDGNGGTVEDAFTVTVKAAPVLASALADVSGLEVGATQEVSLSGVFRDADGDSLSVTAASSDETKATVTVSADQSTLTLAGVAEGTATITVTAQDSDGNRVSDTFDAPVARKYAVLIAQMYQWREDPQWRHQKSHTDRWDRALLAFGETVSDTTLTAMTAAEAQGLADSGLTRWVEVAAALREIESGGQQEQSNRAPTVSAAIADAAIVNQSGTRQVSLSGVFRDADGDAVTVTASSDDEAVATVSVASDYSSLTVSAQARGTAVITVTANDGNGGTVSDTFTVTVKAAPVVASAIADVNGLEVGDTQEVSLSGVFSDADGDALTISAASSDETKATVSVASDGSKLTLSGVAEGTTTITVTAQDTDGNTVSDAFEVSVAGAETQDEGRPTPVSNLSCDAGTDRVTFRWDAPQWSGVEVYAYDYVLGLPDGKWKLVRLQGYPVVSEPGDFKAGTEASISVKAVYENPDGSEVSSEAVTLSCTVEE